MALTGVLKGASGSGGVSTERLCYAVYTGKDTAQIPVMSNLVTDTEFSSYLSYSSSTGKFTVLQDFDAIIVPWVYQYATASSRGEGSFYINSSRAAYYIAETNTMGSMGGKALGVHFTAGDTFWNYTPSSNGYPQQYLKVYKTDEDLSGVLSYANENA